LTAGGSSTPEVHRLLATLAASKPGGCIAEAGTAFGEGARAIADVMSADATFVTVEPDAERLAAARERLAGTRAEIVEGRWQDVLPARAPFDLLFADGGGFETVWSELVDLLAPGGILVKDDLTPRRRIEGDPVREALLRDDRLVSVELLTTPEAAAILAVRRS